MESQPKKKYFQFLKSPCFFSAVGVMLLGLLGLMKRYMPECLSTSSGISGLGKPPPIYENPCGEAYPIIFEIAFGVSIILFAVGLIFCIAKRIRK